MKDFFARLFGKNRPRPAYFNGEPPDVNALSPLYARLLSGLAQDGVVADARNIVRFITRRMDAAVQLANQRSHESLVQAHKEAVETETLLLTWTDRYRPQAPPE